MKKEPLLKNVYLCITNICNCRCKTCDVGLSNRGITTDSYFLENINFSKKEYGSHKLMDRLFEELSNFYPKPQIYITGGEPLISKNFVYFLHKFSSYSGKIVLVTNGTFIENFAKEIARSNISSINISLDGLPKTHSYIRGIPGLFKKVIIGLKKLQSYQKRFNRIQEINVNFTISAFNYQEIYDFAKVILNYKINRIDFLHPQYVSREMALETNKKIPDFKIKTRNFYNHETYALDVGKLNELIKRTKNEFRVKVSFFPEFNSKQIKMYHNNESSFPILRRCRSPWESIQIIQNGDCLIGTPCMPNKLGNIMKDSLREIWHSAKLRRFRSLLRRKKRFPMCAKCCAYYYD